MIFLICVFSLFTGLFPMLAHGVLLRLTMRQHRWTRWIMPVLVALWMGIMMRPGLNPVSFSYLEGHLISLLIWEGMLLLCTRYMERYSA